MLNFFIFQAFFFVKLQFNFFCDWENFLIITSLKFSLFLEHDQCLMKLYHVPVLIPNAFFPFHFLYLGRVQSALELHHFPEDHQVSKTCWYMQTFLISRILPKYLSFCFALSFSVQFSQWQEDKTIVQEKTSTYLRQSISEWKQG